MLTTLVFENKAIHVYPHETLLDALRRNGFDIAAECGKKNRCGSCRIRLLSGNFICNGKMLSVTEDSPVEMNSCALKMLSNGKAEYPQKKTTESFSEIRQDFSIEIPADFPVSLVFDLGTTNVEAALIEKGRISRSTLLNQQTLFGDNVIERIAFAADSAHRETLRRALITETCLPLIKKLTNHPDKIRQVFVSGNTAMTHFFFNADITCLGEAPFQPEKLSFKGTAQSTGLDILLPETPVTAIPCLGGFIGGDITAG
ncbi:MAG: 2Fe-2S iron-sulfur cluster binding domain-containing protein, partial [Lentisphaeria bacterium]|nr:2Fe-2S iron-sulfur cluster binding domain-containing protein [Lentisphaeria bacterium]